MLSLTTTPQNRTTQQGQHLLLVLQDPPTGLHKVRTTTEKKEKKNKGIGLMDNVQFVPLKKGEWFTPVVNWVLWVSRETRVPITVRLNSPFESCGLQVVVQGGGIFNN